MSGRGDLLVVARNGIFRRPAATDQFEHIGNLTHDTLTRSIAVDASDRVWVT